MTNDRETNTMPAPSLGSGSTVLVADDCMVTQAMLKAVVESWGLAYVCAVDGKKALEVLTGDDPPRLALIDWMMPGLNGLEVCSGVREHPDERYIYMILLTSMDQKEDLIRGLESGADDYMFKPFDPAELRVRLLAGQRLVLLQQELQEKTRKLEISNRFVREVFGRYVTDEVASTLLDSPEHLKLGGEKRTVTILMSDLRNFTPLSEKLDPEQVVSVLNRFLGRMVDVILKYKGTIDEFIGDAILVIFGAPISETTQEDALRAAACAIEMQQVMVEFNQENIGLGMPELEMGIGLNTGEVVVGNIGSQRRMKYSVVGSPVNLASRIESFTLGGQILISHTTLRELGDNARVDGRLRVKVKGIEGPVSIFDLGGVGEPYNVELPEFSYHEL